MNRDLIFCTNRANASMLLEHLNACDNSYFPKLSTRVDIYAYTNKILANGIRFEAWDGIQLVGLLVLYRGEFEKKTAFITNVSVLPEFCSQGIASKLLEISLNYLRSDGFTCTELEVSHLNSVACSLYEKFGFVASTKTEQCIKMQLRIQQSI